MSWLIPRNELTAEQIRAIELSPSEHKVIFGAPRSGKTQILLHRARYLIDKYKVSPDRFHIFVYTNVLKSYIKSALELLNLPESCVSTFPDAFRCSPYIVKLGACFIENEDDRDAYIRQSRTEQGERETPLLYYAANFDDEKQKLIELLRIRLAKNEKIGILVPQNRQVFGFAKGLISAGFNVEWSAKPGEGSYNFNSHLPKILTFHSAKGLTFDTIIIPRLVNKSFQRFNEQEITRLLFVGITRAEKWVALLSNKKNGLPQLYKLNALAQQVFLTIQENQKLLKLHEEQKEIDDNKLLDLL